MNEVAIATYLAAFGRTAAFLFSAPVVGGSNMPAKVRIGTAAALAIAVASVRPAVDPAYLPMILPPDILLGLGAGFSLRLIFAGAESGGQIMGMQLGLGMAAFFDPASGERAIVTRRFALVFAGLAFIMMGGLRESVRILAVTPSDAQTLMGIGGQLLDQANHVMSAALRFAAPAIMAGMMTNVGMGFAAKAAPSLNIFSVMLSALLIVGGFMLIVTAPSFIMEITGTARMAIDSLHRMGAQ